MPYIKNKELEKIKKFWFTLAMEMSGGLEHSRFSESIEELWQQAKKEIDNDNKLRKDKEYDR